MRREDQDQADAQGNAVGSHAEPTSESNFQLRPLKYRPLEGQEIRLVKVERSRLDGVLRCRLHHAPLTKDLAFHALSYVWGTLGDKQHIIVNESPIEVTQNLYDFLNQVWKDEDLFRRKSPIAHDDIADPEPVERSGVPLLWWIDAICIDQSNIDEKSIQVPRMRELYSSATQVWMWLGRPENVFSDSKGEFPMLKLALNSTYLRAEKAEKAKPIMTRLSNASIGTTARLVASSIISRMQLELDTSVDRDWQACDEGLSIPELDVVVELLKTGLSEHDIREATGFPADPRHSHPTSLLSDPGKFMLQKLLSEEEAGRLSNTLLKRLLKEFDCLLSNSWFSRTWTIQEFVLSKEPPVALVGGFSFYLTCFYQIGKEIMQNLMSLPLSMQALMRCIGPKFQVLSHLVKTFGLEQGLEYEDVEADARTTERKLTWLMRTYCDNETTVPHDKVYGMLGLLPAKLPDQLVPNYRKRFEDICENFTRHILSSTGDLRIIESHRNELEGTPSWVPDFRHVDRLRGFEFESTTGNVSFSEDGKRLTVEGVLLGGLLGCGCHLPFGGNPIHHLQYIEDNLLAVSALVSDRPLSTIFSDWLTTEMNTNVMLPPQIVSHVTSMQDLITAYHELCAPIPTDAVEALPQISPSDLSFLYNTSCANPALLHVILTLTSLMRYGLVSTSEIGYCRHTDLDSTPEHRQDDEIWALKGSQTLAILRPADGGYRYVGTFRIHKKEFRMTQEMDPRKGFSAHILNEDYFVSKQIQAVTLV